MIGTLLRNRYRELGLQAQDWDLIDRMGEERLQAARRSGGQHLVATACRALGAAARERGRLDEAEAWLIESADLLRKMDCRFPLARTLRELALLRRAQGRSAEAIRLLQEALATFENLRAIPDIQRAHALM